jgi:two-component system KDP operon response regulator KdpE
MGTSITTQHRKRLLLVIGEQPANLQLLKIIFQREGYEVLQAFHCRLALQIVRDTQPDLVIVSMYPPTPSSFELLKALRAFSSVPIIVLSTLNQEEEKVYVLQLGADDYLTVPFSSRELMSRIRAILRRAALSEQSPSEAVVQIDDRLQVDFNLMAVMVEGKRIKLPPHEMRLLRCLMENAGRILTYDTILRRVWKCEYFHPSQKIWVRLYICYLRKKIEHDSTKPQYLLTERGVGYSMLNWKADLERTSTIRVEAEPLEEVRSAR